MIDVLVGIYIIRIIYIRALVLFVFISRVFHLWVQNSLGLGRGRLTARVNGRVLLLKLSANVRRCWRNADIGVFWVLERRSRFVRG